MKKFISLFLVVMMVWGLTACNDLESSHGNEVESESESESTDLSGIQLDCFTFSKEGVDEVWGQIKAIYESGELGEKDNLDDEYQQLHKITTNTIKEQMGIELFDVNRTVFMKDGDEVKHIGSGMINAVPWDYDGDGNLDLLIASEFGSGAHYVTLDVYDTQKSEYVHIHSERWDEWYYNYAVHAATSDNGKDARFEVYKAKYNYEEAPEDAMYVYELEMVVTELLGYIYMENGKPVFEQCK